MVYIRAGIPQKARRAAGNGGTLEPGHRQRATDSGRRGMYEAVCSQSRGTAAMLNQIFTGGRGPLATGWPMGLPLLAVGAVAGYTWPGCCNWLQNNGLRLPSGRAGGPAAGQGEPTRPRLKTNRTRIYPPIHGRCSHQFFRSWQLDQSYGAGWLGGSGWY
jgi:hypothetical protein